MGPDVARARPRSHRATGPATVTAGNRVAACGEEISELTSALVRVPSPNPPGDERGVADVLERYLRQIDGVELRSYEPEPGRVTLVASAGAGPPSLVLAAHTDTHPPGEGWTTDPYG